VRHCGLFSRKSSSGSSLFAALALPKTEHRARIKKQTLSSGASLCALAGEEMGMGWRYESEVQIDFDDFLAAARRIQRIA
jgi:hypothetical protein